MGCCPKWEKTGAMVKKGACLLVMAVVLAISSPGWAGQPGKFATALKNNFCSGTSGAQWYGCYAYMYYRVDYNKNNSAAKSCCYKYGCGGRYSTSPADLENCKSGCNKAFDSDTR